LLPPNFLHADTPTALLAFVFFVSFQIWPSSSWPEPWSLCNTCSTPIRSVRVLPGCSHGVRRWNPLGRRGMLVCRDRLPMSPKTRSLGVGKRKTRSSMGFALGNVLPIITTHDSNLILLYVLCIPQQSGSLKDNFLTTPSSPTMTSSSPAQK
jgi:hypothetical protein